MFSEAKVNELEVQVSVLHAELERLRKENVAEIARSKNLPPLFLDAPDEMEKRVLVCRLRENCHNNDDGCKQKEVFSNGRRKIHAYTSGPSAQKRSPFRDIGNSSPLSLQNCEAVFPLHCPLPSNVKENF